MGPPQILWGPLGPSGTHLGPSGTPLGVPESPRGGIKVGVQQESCSELWPEQLSYLIPHLGLSGTPKGVP